MAISANAVESDLKDNLVVCETRLGQQIRGTVLKMTRFLVVFESYNPTMVLRMSEVLANLRIVIKDQTVYSGRAVVSNLVNAGTMIVCEAKLEESGLHLTPLSSFWDNGTSLGEQFTEFVSQWQKLYRVLPEFKAVMADMQSFLMDLRLWLEQIEIEIRSSPSADRLQLEHKVIADLAGPIVKSIDTFIDRFEMIADRVEDELQPVHRNYLRRQLHPLLLCSPFAYRTFHKPLGYAGDYEVVDMMMRSPHEGSTLFAKLLNGWLLGQAPVEAHRNRVEYLTRKLLEEALRAKSCGHPIRVYNLGCGPATEVQRFLAQQALSGEVEFTMLDFNEETLNHLRTTLEDIKRAHRRTTPIQYIKRSVHQILKESGKIVQRTPESQYDVVYCAGLFDYLSDNVCKRLTNIFYDMLAPGGLLVLTNVSDVMNRSHPFRHSMEYILDWHLIYRDGRQMASLAPDRAPAGSATVITENTGVNVILEVRKPSHG